MTFFHAASSVITDDESMLISQEGTDMRAAESKILAVIPVECGTQRLPGENIRLLAGRPLLAYSIMTARACRRVSRVLVSSNAADVLAAAKSWSAETIIPTETVAGDRAPMVATLEHVLESVWHTGWKPTHVAVFQATSPLRRVAEIDRAIDEYLASDADSALSVNELRVKVGKRSTEGWYTPQCQAGVQDLEPVYQENGAFYITRADLIAQGVLLGPKTLMLQLSPEAGAVSINAEFDSQLAEALYHQLKYEHEFRRLLPVRAA
jgi:N-acylneuraminate cytidylyltransferase